MERIPRVDRSVNRVCSGHELCQQRAEGDRQTATKKLDPPQHRTNRLRVRRLQPQVPRRVPVPTRGAPVAASVGCPWKLRERMDELKREWDSARRHHPRLVLGVAASLFLHLRIVCRWWRASGRSRGLARWPSRPGRHAPHRRDGPGDGGLRRARISWPSRSSRSSGSTCRSPQVSPNLVKAILAIEDQRFYDHHGFDLDPHRLGGAGQRPARPRARRAAARSRSSSRARAS